MRIACVYLPHFNYQIEKLRNPAMEGFPIIIGDAFPSGVVGDERDRTVTDCSDEAAATGIVAGMSLNEAFHRCPDALFLPSRGGYESTWGNVLYALGTFSPRIESGTAGVACLDITKAVKRFKDERTLAKALAAQLARSFGLKATVGVGNSCFVAKQAALCAWDLLVIEEDEEKAFLSLLSTEAPSLEIKEKEKAARTGRVEGMNSYFDARYGCISLAWKEEEERHPRLRERRFGFADL